jgi:excisionase family DNA binding protein
MSATWDDEYLTVKETAEHLKLNQQTVRNWIDQGRLPAVRIGRRVRIPRSDLERILTEGLTAPAEPEPSSAEPVEPRDQLAQALQRAHRQLDRRSAPSRPELADALRTLTDAVESALDMPSDNQSQPANDAPKHLA